MLGRWDQRNWGELCVLACRGDFYQKEGTEMQVDCMPDILAMREHVCTARDATEVVAASHSV